MFQQFRLSRRAVISHFVVSLGICCLSNFGSRRGRGPTSVGRIAQVAYIQRNCARESFALYEQISTSAFELPKRTAIFAHNRESHSQTKSSTSSTHKEDPHNHLGEKYFLTKQASSRTNPCVVVVIFNLIEKRLYLHETFLTEKIPEIAASSLVRDSNTASPQSRGSIAKVLSKFFSSK